MSIDNKVFIEEKIHHTVIKLEDVSWELVSALQPHLVRKKIEAIQKELADIHKQILSMESCPIDYQI